MYRHSSVVPHDIAEVYAWHGRPGAFERLVPPWQPVGLEQQADALEDGSAVLRFPGGLRWVAEHDPSGYDPPYRFVDRLTSLPLAPVLRWRHQHDFACEDGGTRVTDTVTTTLPDRLLRPMFGYRHRQLYGDLAAHASAAAISGGRLLTVAVTGTSGTVGSALVPFLTTGGHRVIRLVRRPARRPDERRWDPEDPATDLLDGVDAVVHLAGAPIAGRLDAAHREAVRDSRVGPTARLATLAARSGVEVFVSASAVGFYGPDRGDEELTEHSERGDGFLADVAVDWEDAALAAEAQAGGTRVVCLRSGVVLTPTGGLLRLQRPLFLAGLGGPIGSGDRWLPWIGLDDLLDIHLRALVDERLEGPVNAVAPDPVTDTAYARALGRALHRPARLRVPALGPRLLLGEAAARELALTSQRVRPAALERVEHRYRYPDVEDALRHVLGTHGG